MNAEAYAVAPPPSGLFAPRLVEMPPDEISDDIFDLPVEKTTNQTSHLPELALVEDDAEDDAPDPKGSVSLRDYQIKADKAVVHEFNSGARSTLVVSATGTGKSVILASLAHRFNNWNHNALLLVHRDELIRQLSRSCARVGIAPLIEKAQERALKPFQYFGQTMGAQTVIASVQTLRGKRLEEWPRDAFKLIIVDEAHHAAAASYGDVLRHFHGAKVAGFTATADRLDSKNVGSVFETLAFEYNVRDAIGDGWLVPIEARQLKTDPQINLRDLRITAGDFNSGDLEKAVNDNIGVLVNAVRDTNALESRRTIAFTPNVSSAEALALALEDIGITARGVSSNSPDRAEVLKAHQNGQFQVLVNCMILTEGYDDPEVSAILVCRPTKSRSLYSQMVGRGTRLHPESGKTNCRIVDFAYLTSQHDLVSPVDLYDNAGTPDEVVQAAREEMAAGRETDIELALEKAQEKFEAERRVRIQRRAVSVRASSFDPVAACEIFNIQQKSGYDWQDMEPATEKQLNALRKWGIAAPDDTGKGTAKKLLDKVFSRAKHGWAGPRQVAQLIESGFDPQAATGMRDVEARDYLAKNPLGASEKQIKMLRWKGVSDAEIAGMTRKEASARIDLLMKTI